MTPRKPSPTFIPNHPRDTPATRRSTRSKHHPPTGIPSIIGAVTAILGVLTAVWPDIPVLEAICAAVPQFEIAIPVLLTSVGAITAALTHPPSAGQ